MSGTANLYINSDFTDYYDKAASNVQDENSVLYNRIMQNVPGKVEELRTIGKMGNKTIQILPINRMSPTINKVIVYTDIKGHRGNGKTIMSLSEANMMYPNKLGTEYFSNYSGYTFKVLTVGKRRFKCILKNIDNLIESETISIEELPSGYNYQIALPIYSIDYIQDNSNQMVIADFNTIQRLDYLGLEKFMSAEEVLDEIYKALIAYNKI